MRYLIISIIYELFTRYLIISMGSGKMIVEFFSAEIELRV